MSQIDDISNGIIAEVADSRRREALTEAAPELLAACKTAYGRTQEHINFLYNSHAHANILHMWRALNAQLAEAISKAEG